MTPLPPPKGARPSIRILEDPNIPPGEVRGYPLLFTVDPDTPFLASLSDGRQERMTLKEFTERFGEVKTHSNWNLKVTTDTTPPPLVEATLIALRPLESAPKNCTLYEVINDQQTILENPELSVFRDEKAALAHLHKGTRAPAGTTRIIDLSQIPHHARIRMTELPYELRYWRNHNRGYLPDGSYGELPPRPKSHILVSDIPFIVDAKNLLPSTVKTFKNLPCLTDSAANALRKDPLYSELTTSRLWGSPTFGLTQLTKAGVPKRKPTKTMEAKKKAWQEARLSLLHSALVDFQDHLTTILQIPLRRGNKHNLFYYNLGYLSLTESEKKLWSYPIRRSAHSARHTADALLSLLRVARGSDDYGVLRTPLSFLRHKRLKELFTLLETLAPFLPSLKNFNPPPEDRLSQATINSFRRDFLSLHQALYRFVKALGLRSFPGVPIPPTQEIPPCPTIPDPPPSPSPPPPSTSPTEPPSSV